MSLKKPGGSLKVILFSSTQYNSLVVTDEEKISRTPYFAWWKFPKMLILPFDVLTSAVTSFALLGCPSLRASSPIWASETSLARTRERAAKPRGENLLADLAVFIGIYPKKDYLVAYF